MNWFGSHLRRIVGDLLAPSAPTTANREGPVSILDGISAITATEAAICGMDAVGIVGGPGRAVDFIDATGARGTLAAATGLAMSGERAAVLLAGPDLDATQDLLTFAAGQHLPLIVHLVCRATAGHAPALGSGHEAWHGAADRGLFQLFAINAQEAVDLAVIARMAAERALVPGMVAMDGEQSAFAIQDVRLPDEELLRTLLGAPTDRIETPTDAQRLLDGSARRRVPRRHDLDHPFMLAPVQGPEAWGLGAAASATFFHDPLDEILEDAFRGFAEQTGKPYAPLIEHRVDDAEIVLVAQGAAVETLIAVADRVRAHDSTKVGVLGVRCLRPFPGAQIASALGRATTVAVLERVATPLAGDGPLLREVRAALDRATENARFEATAHPGYPTLETRHRPRLVNVSFGLGGMALRGSDVTALLERLARPDAARLWLGVDFVSAGSDYPKRQALADTLRRARPDLATLGVRARTAPPPLLPKDATSIAIFRRTDDPHATFTPQAATLIHALLDGSIRARPAIATRGDTVGADLLIHGPALLRDPGDDVAYDVAVLAAPVLGPTCDPAGRLAEGGAVLIAGDAETWRALPAAWRRALIARGAAVWTTPVTEGVEHWRDAEALLGGLAALMIARTSRTTPVDLRGHREAASLDTLEPGRVETFLHAFEGLTRLDPSALEVTDDERTAPAPTITTASTALAGFWSQVGVLYRDGAVDALAPDPFLAAASTPPRTAALCMTGSTSERMLVFDPISCTGHGRLWTSAPDGSVLPVVVTPRVLVETGIERAAAAGRPADALRAVAPKIAKRMYRMMRNGDWTSGHAGELLRGAFENVAQKTDLPDDRRAALMDAIDAVIDAVGPLLLARTPTFFDAPESESTGSGALFGLVVNPDAGGDVDVVAALAAEPCLDVVARTPERVDAARQRWEIARTLPDTPAAIIERAERDGDVGPLAARLLDRAAHQVLTPGDAAEPGSGARLALQWALGLADHFLGERRRAHRAVLDTFGERLGQNIRTLLADALPTGDLDALAEGLDALGRRDVDLAAISARVDEAVEHERVDGARLGRLVDVARELSDLTWHLSDGPRGTGRAPYGVVLAPGTVTDWAGPFPDNAFACPVAVSPTAEAPALARGLLQGQLQQAVAGARLTRWAEAELERPTRAVDEVETLRSLRFADLTGTERAACPPIILIGDEHALGGAGVASVIGLLDSDRPIKIIVLDGLDGDRDVLPLALLARRAFVAQTSLAHPDHFARSVRDALTFDGPALVVVPAPSPARHGFAPARLIEQARLAVTSRVAPLLRYDPAAEGRMGDRLDLAGNDVPAEPTTVDADVPVSAFAAATDESAQRWTFLQELAGARAPLTTSVTESDDHAGPPDQEPEDVEEMKQTFETQLAAAREAYARDATQRVTEGLMALAGYGPDEPDAADAPNEAGGAS